MLGRQLATRLELSPVIGGDTQTDAIEPALERLLIDVSEAAVGHEKDLLTGVVDIPLGNTQAEQGAPEVAAMGIENFLKRKTRLLRGYLLGSGVHRRYWRQVLDFLIRAARRGRMGHYGLNRTPTPRPAASVTSAIWKTGSV